MNFVIPESVIQTEGFQVKSPTNLFFLYMLSRNWHAWASEYKPLRDFEQIYENQDAVAEELKQSPAKHFWTVVGIDECEYLVPGIQVWDGNGFYTHGFIETQYPSTGYPWPGHWTPDARLNAPGFTIEFQSNPLLRTVFINCDLCPVGESDDCEHWDGETGSWVSVDFDIPDPAVIEGLLLSVAGDSSLGVLSCLAASLLVKEFLNSPHQDAEASLLKAQAVSTFRSLNQTDREIVLQDPQVLPEFIYVLFTEGAFVWQHNFGNLMLKGNFDAAEEVLNEISKQTELQEENWTAINTLVFSILIPARRFEEARMFCQELINRSSGFEYWNAISNLGSAEFYSGNLIEAKALFNSILQHGEGPVEEANEFLGRITSLERASN